MNRFIALLRFRLYILENSDLIMAGKTGASTALRRIVQLGLCAALVLSCGGKKSLDGLDGDGLIIEEPGAENPLDNPSDSAEGSSGNAGESSDGQIIGPSDPPYGVEVVFPSGLHLAGLGLVPELTAAYPSISSGLFPFATERGKHYVAVQYFIAVADLSTAQRDRQVAKNFKLNEYVRIPERNGDDFIYVDPQMTQHAQELRDAWGGPLVLTSSYRSPEYNAAIGGATFSRHMYGDAVDIRADSEAMAWDLYNLAKFLGVSYLETPERTIINRNTPWIHLDDRGWPLNTSATR